MLNAGLVAIDSMDDSADATAGKKSYEAQAKHIKKLERGHGAEDSKRDDAKLAVNWTFGAVEARVSWREVALGIPSCYNLMSNERKKKLELVDSSDDRHVITLFGSS